MTAQRAAAILSGLGLLGACACACAGARAADEPTAALASRDAVFIETTVEVSRPYVQAAVPVTVRLYTAVPLARAVVDLPVDESVLVQQVGADETAGVMRGGRRLQMTSRHYLLFPQRSGRLVLPGLKLDAQVAVDAAGLPFDTTLLTNLWSRFPFGNLFGRTQAVHLQGAPIVLDVQPRPAGAFRRYWLPARALTLRGEWDLQVREVHAGEPANLMLQVEAVGLTAAQLPDLADLLDVPPGVKLYPEPPRLTNAERGELVVGRREERVAFIVEQPGLITLPGVTLHWWDLAGGVERVASLPARRLLILPALAADRRMGTRAGSSGPPNVGQAGRTFAILALTVALGALAARAIRNPRLRRAAARALLRSRQSVEAPDAGACAAGAPAAPRRAWRQFRRACARHEPQHARRALLEWARGHWVDAPPAGLRALAERIDAAHLRPLFADLDRACYAGGSWHGRALLEALESLPMPRAARRPKRTPLAPLYD